MWGGGGGGGGAYAHECRADLQEWVVLGHDVVLAGGQPCLSAHRSPLLLLLQLLTCLLRELLYPLVHLAVQLTWPLLQTRRQMFGTRGRLMQDGQCQDALL